MGGGVDSDTCKILLEDYTILESKIDKETVMVQEKDSTGNIHEISRLVPSEVLAIRFKKIIKTFRRSMPGGEDDESYQFLKALDADGNPTDSDAEFYCFTGSKIMIDQAKNDFTLQDLPAPTVIVQAKGKDGKLYTKFT